MKGPRFNRELTGFRALSPAVTRGCVKVILRMRMRFCVWAVAVLCAVTAAQPLRAEEPVFSPQAFQVFGGMSDGCGSSGSLLKHKNLGALAHTTGAFEGDYPAGTIIVRTGERRHYYVL